MQTRLKFLTKHTKSLSWEVRENHNTRFWVTLCFVSCVLLQIREISSQKNRNPKPKHSASTAEHSDKQIHRDMTPQRNIFKINKVKKVCPCLSRLFWPSYLSRGKQRATDYVITRTSVSSSLPRVLTSVHNKTNQTKSYRQRCERGHNHLDCCNKPAESYGNDQILQRRSTHSQAPLTTARPTNLNHSSRARLRRCGLHKLDKTEMRLTTCAKGSPKWQEREIHAKLNICPQCPPRPCQPPHRQCQLWGDTTLFSECYLHHIRHRWQESCGHTAI